MPEFEGTARYRVIDRIGQGGMGVVYRVWDEELSRPVALKTLRRPGAGEVFRLKTEFRSRKEINHPNIVDFYDLVVEDDGCFFTMELVDGTDFLSYVRTQPLSGLVDADTMDVEDEPVTADATGEEPLRPGQHPRPLRRKPLAVDLARLHEGLRQLVLGLDALHQVGCLHRDIKPGNVLVAPDGRVVVLDFGLAVDLDPSSERARVEGPVAGTAAYMSPEAVWKDGLGPAADLYSVGVMIFEALVGRRPWRGAMFEVLRAKQTALPPPPSTWIVGVPPQLESLCMDLLEPDPDDRPSAAEILARLGGQEPDRADATLTGAVAMDLRAPFVGREDERERLAAALARAEQGQQTTVHIHGRSGMGKSTLLRRFLQDLDRVPGLVVLEGRCHLHESVPFKALDGVVDGLSRMLVALSPAAASALVPKHVSFLLRLFPVLTRVEALASAADPLPDGVDPNEIRRRGVDGLRELLLLIGKHSTLVVWIDDLQWGDLDSAAVLRELLRPPLAPALLLLLSWRAEEREASALLRELLGGGALALPGGPPVEISVAPLDAGRGRELAAAVLGSLLPLHEHRIPELLRDAAGSPFLIAQLVHYVASSDGDPSGDFAPTEETPRSGRYLGNIVLRRVARLSLAARALLETISVAARPLERRFALEAAGLGEESRPLVRQLERDFLLRTTQIADRIAVEAYHDRIREAVVEGLDVDARRMRHRSLAEALLRQADPEPQALVEHFTQAGLPARAGAFAVAAADRASAALAFERAARLYALALELAPVGSDPLELTLKRAEALANSGRGKEAGGAWRQAAALFAARGGPDSGVEILRCTHLAADQYLRAGAVDEGMEALTAVLAEAGLTMPRSQGAALLEILWRRAMLSMRGLHAAARPAGPLSAERLIPLDAAWGATTTLSLIDPLTAGVFGVRHLRAALELGEPRRVARALGHEASYQASIGGAGGRAAAAGLLARVEELTSLSDTPYDRAWLDLARGTSAYLGGRWGEAARACDAATADFRAHCTGVAWELVSTESFAVSALAHAGHLQDVRVRRARLVHEAEERGDLFATTGFRLGILVLDDLATGDAAAVIPAADELIVRWPGRAFLTQHYLHLVATVTAAVFAGDGAEAVRRMEEAWPRLKADHFLRLQTMRVELRHLRARAALCAGGAAGRAVARRESKAIRKDGDHPVAGPAAALLDAAVAAGEGADQRATDCLITAAAGFEAAGMRLYAAACRYAEGGLHASRGGASKRDDAAQTLAAEGIVDVPAFVRMLAPGFGG